MGIKWHPVAAVLTLSLLVVTFADSSQNLDDKEGCQVHDQQTVCSPPQPQRDHHDNSCDALVCYSCVDYGNTTCTQVSAPGCQICVTVATLIQPNGRLCYTTSPDCPVSRSPLGLIHIDCCYKDLCNNHSVALNVSTPAASGSATTRNPSQLPGGEKQMSVAGSRWSSDRKLSTILITLLLVALRCLV